MFDFDVRIQASLGGTRGYHASNEPSEPTIWLGHASMVDYLLGNLPSKGPMFKNSMVSRTRGCYDLRLVFSGPNEVKLTFLASVES